MDDTTKNITWMLQQQNVTWTLQLKTSYGLCNPKHHIKGDSKRIRTVGTIGRNRTRKTPHKKTRHTAGFCFYLWSNL